MVSQTGNSAIIQFCDYLNRLVYHNVPYLHLAAGWHTNLVATVMIHNQYLGRVSLHNEFVTTTTQSCWFI